MSDQNLSLVIFRRDTGEIALSPGYIMEPEYHQIVIDGIRSRWSDEYEFMRGTGDIVTDYVMTLGGEPVVVPKPSLQVRIDKTEILADGEDIATLTGLPDPCTIIVDDDDPLTPTTVVEVAGGGFTFSTEDPGPYSFEVRGRFPFLPWKAVVTAS